MAYKPRLQTKQDLKDYILRRLGFPVVNVELVDAMLDDRIDDTVETYMQRAYSGVVERYVLFPILKGRQNYTLPYETFALLEVMGQGMLGITNSTPSNLFSLNQFVAADLYRGAGKIDLLTYEMTNQMLEAMEIVFTQKISYDFNCISKDLYLMAEPQQDQMVMLHVYNKNVPVYSNDEEGNEVEGTNIYNEMWIRNMAFRQCQYQWATNLLKYSGSALPNGLVLAVPEILAEAKEGITELKEELANFELPIDFMIG